jgi:uncharacterized protein
MTTAVVVAGMLIQAVAWRLVATDRTAFWPTTAATWAVVGLAAVLAGDPRCCADVRAATAIVAGLAAGAILYAATRVVVEVATRAAPSLLPPIDDVYGRGAEAPDALVWAVTLLVVVPGEELFWRGLALPELQRGAGEIVGAIVAWLAAVAVTAVWGSLPFLAAAIVGGAVWTALGAWSGGVVAPLACHAVWTSAMIAWRPRDPRAKVPS